MGVTDGDKFISIDGVRQILKTVLPHQSKFIDENEPESYYHLLEEIELHLLFELRKVLEGKQADQEATVRARDIMHAVNDAVEKQAQRTIPDDLKTHQ